ncbi:hypothetical protein A2U01_0063317, partial [Trifolium medium]|nr:hypothetical protein [Trifolium medium]
CRASDGVQVAVFLGSWSCFSRLFVLAPASWSRGGSAGDAVGVFRRVWCLGADLEVLSGFGVASMVVRSEGVVVGGGAEVVTWWWVAHCLRFDGACGRLVIVGVEMGGGGGW